jgi:hypothetical protein
MILKRLNGIVALESGIDMIQKYFIMNQFNHLGVTGGLLLFFFMILSDRIIEQQIFSCIIVKNP